MSFVNKISTNKHQFFDKNKLKSIVTIKTLNADIKRRLEVRLKLKFKLTNQQSD